MIKRYSTTAIALSALMLLGSCSIIKPKEDKKTPDAVIPIPADREAISPEKSDRVYTPDELAKGIVKGDWAIDSIYGKKAVGETAPFLKFDTANKMIYGNNGCNTVNASYTYNPADSLMQFSGIITTLMECSKQGISDYEINHALDATRKYTWSANGSEYYLRFYDGSGAHIMTLMHQNFHFLNGTWIVESIGDREINTPTRQLSPDMKLVIDIDEEKVHGNTGCNILNGLLLTDMDLPNTISFERMATTRRMCPPKDNYEADLLVALEEVTTARPTSADTVDMINSHGEVVLRLRRCSDK